MAEGRRVGRRQALAAFAAAACSSRTDIHLRGAGATIPSAQYRRWFAAFSAAVPRVTIEYAAVGSGAGLQLLRHERVDFGASDVDIQAVDRVAFERSMLAVPVAMSALCLACNLPELGTAVLRLRRETVARMYLGEVDRWDDPAIAADNPGAALPARSITPVGRADGGGSTAIFSRGLAASTPRWSERAGVGLSVTHPRSVNARGSDGVIDVLTRLPGAIGYVEVARAVSASLRIAMIDDAHGRFVAPTTEAVREAALGLEAAGDLSAFPATGYPLASPTFVVLPRELEDVGRGAALARLLYWILLDGQTSLAERAGGPGEMSTSLAPLPPEAAASARDAVRGLRSGATPLLAID